MSAELIKRIEDALDTMRPFLRADGGDVQLVSIEPDMVVKLRLLGACSACEMSHMTMKAGIEEGIRKSIPEIMAVVAVNE